MNVYLQPPEARRVFPNQLYGGSEFGTSSVDPSLLFLIAESIEQNGNSDRSNERSASQYGPPTRPSRSRQKAKTSKHGNNGTALFVSGSFETNKTVVIQPTRATPSRSRRGRVCFST